MQHLPIGINLNQKACLVVGGGEVATRKIERLLDAGAIVTVVTEAASDKLQALNQANKIRLVLRQYQSSDLNNQSFAIAATDNSETNKRIAAEADLNKIWCNNAEANVGNAVIFPTLIRRDPLVISVSSGGSSPVLAKVLSDQIDAFVPQYTSQLAELAGEFRQHVKDRFNTIEQRRDFWKQAITGKVSTLLKANKPEVARAELEQSLKDKTSQKRGEVYLIGAGPGDPELLTLRALRLMQLADVVLHDRLVSDEIMALCPVDAERIYVGKERSSHAMRQQNINQSLVDHAKQGKRVLRLKGGDPFIFGRGGEEIETLAENGVDFQVVPGITAASGCGSYAGIPLTHRDYAQSCVFVTGQLKNGTIDLPWASLAIPGQTIVCYMGLVGLPHMCQSLIDAKLPADTPAALVERGTTKNQRVIVGTVTTLPDLVKQQEVKAPTLIIIGQVVRLQNKLAWIDNTGLV